MSLLLVAACGDSGVDSGTSVQPHAGIDGLPKNSGNGQASSAPAGYFSYEPPLLPITFTVDTNGNVSVDAAINVETPLGRITFAGNVARTASNNQPLADQSFDVTQLIICKDGSGRKDCQGYQIGSGRKLKISMDGRFEQTVERNRITIDAQPDSTIDVTDAGGPTRSGARPAALIDIEEFDFSPQGSFTDVDLERSALGSAADLSYDHVTGDLKPINTALVSVVKLYRAKDNSFAGPGLPAIDLPGENDCAQTKPSAWQSGFGADQLKADIIVACVETAESDFGYLVIGHNAHTKPTSYYVYSYTWVR